MGYKASFGRSRAAGRRPNQGGTGPAFKKQGKSGPIIGKMTSVTGVTKPFTLKGQRRSILKGNKP